MPIAVCMHGKITETTVKGMALQDCKITATANDGSKVSGYGQVNLAVNKWYTISFDVPRTVSVVEIAIYNSSSYQGYNAYFTSNTLITDGVYFSKTNDMIVAVFELDFESDGVNGQSVASVPGWKYIEPIQNPNNASGGIPEEQPGQNAPKQAADWKKMAIIGAGAGLLLFIVAGGKRK